MESGLPIAVRLDRRQPGMTVPDDFADHGLAELLILPLINGGCPAGTAAFATADRQDLPAKSAPWCSASYRPCVPSESYVSFLLGRAEWGMGRYCYQ